MSAAQIIAELPKLTEADRRAVQMRLLELAQENEDIALCNHSADEAARLLDELDSQDEGLQKG